MKGVGPGNQTCKLPKACQDMLPTAPSRPAKYEVFVAGKGFHKGFVKAFSYQHSDQQILQICKSYLVQGLRTNLQKLELPEDLTIAPP